MAQVVITFKIMPNSPSVSLKRIEKEAEKLVSDFEGEVGKVEEVPLAFGLKALNIIFVMNEDKGSPDELEESVGKIKGVKSVDVIDVRRALG